MKTIRTVLFTLMAVITAISVFVAVFQSAECDCPEPSSETQTSERLGDREPIASSVASDLLNVLRTIITIMVMIFLVAALWQVARFFQVKRKRL